MGEVKIDTVYVFGAGASFNTHPIINEFHKLGPLNERELLKFGDPEKKDSKFKPFALGIENYLSEYDFYKKLEQFKTPDNYAHFLWNQGIENNETNFERYIAIKKFYNYLANFFSVNKKSDTLESKDSDQKNSYIQLPEGQYLGDDQTEPLVDYRYVTLINNLLVKENKKENFNFLEKNVRFYTWNYDKSLYFTLKSIFQEEYKSENLISYLNGSCSELDSGINFYWENSKNEFNILGIKNLVYIGYSFPIVNRRKDIEIITTALNYGAKLILQSKEPDKLKETIIQSDKILNSIDKGCLNNKILNHKRKGKRLPGELELPENRKDYIEDYIKVEKQYDAFYIPENLYV